ncbi:MAG: hypothetical protein A3A90_01880 [Candidatus Zambryskibacteria bacterium RIFCSPLOWO2_01_FULL_35_19]|uniref:Uncharacterized protein n=1 Tax=Candidatus Zambryskibacteria bacterium RIFCSPLOWO2_01_FULL_35_19 TaxID=1802757 RepID=A0A1G2TW25_9BACT|nr:MAG: hypothetical protein A2726_01540 [Candidatus Zambryskibacteria bacterium RIFCSPHIGHO2_01_FULL_35_32]OHB01528.1 MAG: hypothetical protein A3A90_01880 [Candidatus Zambryskibacteria bacterium RIFCSPLOWO2_01_FULL_35_19]
MKKLSFFLSFITLLIPVNVMACSCGPSTVQENVKWADVIFAGEATKVEYIEADSDALDEPRIIVTFTVSQFWKGDVRKTIILHTTYNKYSCGGYYFEESQKFIVYAKKYLAEDWLGSGRPKLSGITYPKPDELVLGTVLCTRTNFLARADEDIKMLGRGETPK